MLKINPELVSQINNAASLEELFPMLQSAIELEHSTIPPYLTAMFSFKPNTGKEIRTVIHSIVIEEMLHMSIACNILNALGGSPSIDRKEFVPDYKCPLPMGIGDGLIVGLEPYSQTLVHDIFMQIEEPEHPIEFQVAAKAAVEYKTIGEFYTALQEQIELLAPEVLPGDPAKQVTSAFFPASELFPILRKEDAINAIDIIIEQGEGTSTTPKASDTEYAHYYKFEELYRGLTLVPDPTAPNGYIFTQPAIPFNQADVNPLFPNTKAAMLPAGSEERRRADEFNASYSSLLAGLHRTFNGDPGYLPQTIGVMFDMRLAAEKLGAMPFPGKAGYTVGPPFEWVPQP